VDIQEVRRQAEAGSCVNQCVLGLCYLYGNDVDVDYKEAFQFLSAAADQGASRAVLNLGYMYAKGLGIPKNVPEAIRLFEAVGRPEESSVAFLARIELGRIYSAGISVPVDADAARKWYTAAIALASEGVDSDELREAKTYVSQSNPGV
jgi:TPR repeat protein